MEVFSKEFERADEIYKKISLKYDDAILFKQWANFYSNIGRFDESEKMLVDLLKKYSYDGSIYSDLSLIYVKKEEYENAKNILEKGQEFAHIPHPIQVSSLMTTVPPASVR